MQVLSLDDALHAVTMLLNDEGDIDLIWSCDVINNLIHAPSITDVVQVGHMRWISMNDAKPDKDGRYFVYFGQSPLKEFVMSYDDLVGIASWYKNHDGWWSLEMERPIIGITHWMPMAEPPKE